MAVKVILITCEGAALVPPADLSPLQGELKTLEAKEYAKLRRAIEKRGFSFPLSVWKESESKLHVLDGHQRLNVVSKMLKEGWKLDGGRLPVDWIEARSMKEAKEKVLLAASQYGRYTEDSVYEFVHTSGLAWGELKQELDLPQLNMGKLEIGWFSEGDIDGGSGDGDQNAVKSPFGLFSAGEIIEDAFLWFRATGFPYPSSPVHVQKQILNRLNAGQDISTNIADYYHRHRFSCSATGKKSELLGFENDKALKMALSIGINCRLVKLEVGGALRSTHGVQGCSNFPPKFARDLYVEFGKPSGVVMDPCAGYGGRLVGWIASGLGGRYVGVEPCRLTYEGNQKLAAALCPPGYIAEMYNVAFEDFEINKYRNKVDFIFTSPPYFNRERYSDESTQSWVRYKTYESWVNGFIKPMASKWNAVLRPGSFCALNIDDITGHNLCDDAVREFIDAGLELHEKRSLRFSNRKSVSENNDELDSSEPLFIFQKPAGRGRS